MRRAILYTVVVIAAAVTSLGSLSPNARRWLVAAWAQEGKAENEKPAAKEEPADPKPADGTGTDVAEDLNQGRFEELAIPPSLDVRGKTKQELADTRQRITAVKAMVNAVTSGEQQLAANQPNFDNYFNQYLFPRLTWVANIESPSSFNFLVEQRNLILNQYLRKPTLPAEVHDQLVRIVAAGMTKIATGNYHPAARHNAMLIIAELNTKELVRVPVTPPEPYAAALTPMVDALGDPMQLDVVRVAALVGILRHVQWDTRQREKLAEQPAIKRIEDPLRDRIGQLAMAIINTKAPPAGRTLDGHAWMQRRSIEILSVMGTISSDINAAQTIEAFVSDNDAPISLRCTAAEALGLLNLPAETKLDAMDSARKLGELAVYLGRRELKRVEDEKKFLDDKRKAGSSSGLGGFPGGMPGPGGMGAGAGAGMSGPPAPGAGGAGAGAPAAGMPGAGGDGDFAGGAGMGMPGMGMPGMGPPGMGMGKGGAASKKAVDDYKRELVQRRLRSQMQSIKIGLFGASDKPTGIISLTKDAKQQALVKKLVDEIAGLRDITDDDKFREFDKLIEEVNRRLKLIDTATKALAVAKNPAAAAAAADEEDGPNAGPAKPAAGKPAAKPAAGKPAAAKPAAAGDPAAAKPAEDQPAAAKPDADMP
ncbi:MAG: hypothetical protein ACKOBW_00060 [Planctomycetota bacterium]